jgi:hypothetical protein
MRRPIDKATQERIRAWKAGASSLATTLELSQKAIAEGSGFKQPQINRVVFGEDNGSENCRLVISQYLGSLANLSSPYDDIIALGRIRLGLPVTSAVEDLGRRADKEERPIEKPAWDDSHLRPEERRLLIWLLEVIRCPGAPHVVDIAKKSVRLWRDQVAMTRGEANKD